MDGMSDGAPLGMRAVLADREPAVRSALRALTTQGLGMLVVGEACDQATLHRQVEALRPDLVILAWDLVDDGAEEALAALRESSAGLRVVVLGLRPETRPHALAAGADAYISMEDAPDVVTRVLQAGPRAAGSERLGTSETTSEPGGPSWD
jgi:DNA-binding NarL/FixJ family response regulator